MSLGHFHAIPVKAFGLVVPGKPRKHYGNFRVFRHCAGFGQKRVRGAALIVATGRVNSAVQEIQRLGKLRGIDVAGT